MIETSYGTLIIGNHAERWIYRVETDEYVFIDKNDYTSGCEIEPKDYKIIIPGQIINGLIELLEDTRRIHQKDRTEEISIINRLIDTIQLSVKK